MGRLTRRRFLQRAGAAALGTAGIYGLVDGLSAETARAMAAVGGLPPEQHVLHGVRVITDNNVEVVVPPIHHQVVTAVVRVDGRKTSLLEAKRRLEAALAGLEQTFAPTPAGLGVTVAWGRPYFRRYVPAARLPIDRRASKAAGKPVSALIDAIRFPSDPHGVILEGNDLCVLFRSDSLGHIAAGSEAVFGGLNDLFELTSIRKGFVGGGLPRRMAIRAGIRGAESIPISAQLFLGFTSTQKAALGPELIANLETLPGLTDQWPDGYFRHGTTMHLSHLYEDLQAWYERFTYNRRLWAAFRPGLSVPDGTLTVPEGPANVESQAEVVYDAGTSGQLLTGHSGALQPATRLAADTRDNYGIRNRKNTALIQRADFNTLDSPFFWSSRPKVDRHLASPSAGLHFVAFSPTSDSFHRARMAMDGHYPDGTVLELDPRGEAQGFNSVLRTTHRQNYLVPPRRHRSFPLVELL